MTTPTQRLPMNDISGNIVEERKPTYLGNNFATEKSR